MSINQTWIDEILEAIWIAQEEHLHSINDIEVISNQDTRGEVDVKTTLLEMSKVKLVKKSGETIQFTPEGKRRAEVIIRRHRLAERLLTDVLNVSQSSMEATACQFEHILNPEVTDSVCAFLGHPPLCPHGKQIPPGDCCQTYRRGQIKPLISRLSDLELGKEGKIAFITPSFHQRFDRLTAFGVIPGNSILVHQRQPSFVVRIGETELAIDRDIAREVFVITP